MHYFTIFILAIWLIPMLFGIYVVYSTLRYGTVELTRTAARIYGYDAATKRCRVERIVSREANDEP